MIEGPVQFGMHYTLPSETGTEVYTCDYQDSTWFMPATGVPSIDVSVIAGRLIMNYV